MTSEQKKVLFSIGQRGYLKQWTARLTSSYA